jgi:hypothetical protein
MKSTFSLRAIGVAGAYNPFGSFAVRTPLIKNNGGSANTLHGVAYTP